ncbi:MAG: hypothetical protein DYG89_02305 [Caldilinea sp. CFX5]|nr:hypothetical protein [Caldilinea sp. CFX5]
MVEHVGRANLPTYFARAYHSLRPHGLFLNHGITAQSNVATGDYSPRLMKVSELFR